MVGVQITCLQILLSRGGVDNDLISSVIFAILAKVWLRLYVLRRNFTEDGVGCEPQGRGEKDQERQNLLYLWGGKRKGRGGGGGGGSEDKSIPIFSFCACPKVGGLKEKEGRAPLSLSISFGISLSGSVVCVARMGKLVMVLRLELCVWPMSLLNN